MVPHQFPLTENDRNQQLRVTQLIAGVFSQTPAVEETSADSGAVGFRGEPTTVSSASFISFHAPKPIRCDR
jgi:hypothetical protein